MCHFRYHGLISIAGLNLVEERQVLYCNVCTRYIPIRDSVDEAKVQHCTTFTHVKAVDDHYAHEERQKEKKARQEKEKKISDSTAETSKETEEKTPSGTKDGSGEEQRTTAEAESVPCIKEEHINSETSGSVPSEQNVRPA